MVERTYIRAMDYFFLRQYEFAYLVSVVAIIEVVEEGEKKTVGKEALITLFGPD